MNSCWYAALVCDRCGKDVNHTSDGVCAACRESESPNYAIAFAEAQAELTRLRELLTEAQQALQDIMKCGTYDGHSDLCETLWESVDEARCDGASEEEIEADLRQQCYCPAKQTYIAEQALKRIQEAKP